MPLRLVHKGLMLRLMRAGVGGDVSGPTTAGNAPGAEYARASEDPGAGALWGTGGGAPSDDTTKAPQGMPTLGAAGVGGGARPH